MHLRLKLYHLLVNRVPAIQKKYHSIRQQKKGTGGRVYAWFALLGMNIQSLFAGRKFAEAFYYPDIGKKLPKEKSESALSFRESPKKLAVRLKQYDIISFDVFDTLVLRPFAVPTDLFFLVGKKLGYLDFERIRREMEWRARQKAKKQTGHYEVTLEQIYEEMETQAGIPKDIGMQAEIETELELCFGNPYMLEVFRYLKESGKTIICTSDMYLPKAVIKKMVEKCGFRESDRAAGICEYFISCEEGAAKGNGSLFERVKDTYGPYKKYIHMGDNPAADVKWARKSGFDAEFYQNVNIAGMPYRAENMSIINGSVYRGIVNAHIHNGLCEYSQEYELGFIYGGLFVLGYCQWIHEYVRTHDIDKILFLSRDGEILHRVYDMLYPNESKEGKTEYVYWSRLAATKMSARYFKYDYFRRFLHHKVNQGYTLEEIFKSMELEDMLTDMCRNINLSRYEKFVDKNVEVIKAYLLEHWEEVLAHYDKQLAAGKLYYEKVLAGFKRVAAVDVGWAGSGAVSLNYVINHIWQLNCEVTGLVAGTNTIHNAEPNMSEPQLHSGELESYLFSQGHNRDSWKWHDAAKGHNVGIELLCSSAGGSVKGFYPKRNADGKADYTVHFKEADMSPAVVSEIQKGITDFVKLVLAVPERACLLQAVTGSDVYGVMKVFLEKENYASLMEAINDSGGEAIEMGI